MGQIKMEELPLLFGIENWGEFGQIRYTETIAAGATTRIALTPPAGKWWVIFKYRFGDLTADVLKFRFNNIRNYFEQWITIGIELLDQTIYPKPYLVVSGGGGEIIVENTDDESQDFEIVLDFYIIDNELKGRIRELIMQYREDFRKLVTQLAYKTPEIVKAKKVYGEGVVKEGTYGKPYTDGV
ncbi:unnamed protein product [marine sediment metagenome]|uniref:Uncharacterized protein n=1 Tax=marine sediment metagenome TaxID=412755 RepID=X1SBE1_9ZZZZ